MNFEKVKYYFEAGLWNKAMVKNAVKKGVITKEQYAEIVGAEYTAPAGAASTTEERVTELEEALDLLLSGETGEEVSGDEA